MSKSLAELKAAVMIEMEGTVDRLLAKVKSPNEISLTEIEAAALELGQATQNVLIQQLVVASSEERLERPKCPTCQQPMRNKGYRERPVVTQSGEVRLRRAYYYCATCQTGIFPPG